MTELLSLFAYDANTGVVIRLKPRGNRKAGAVVGSRTTFGHLSTEIFGRHVKVHQLAWALHFGEWPISDIDHVNGKPADNRLCNLRLATASENLRNSKPYRKISDLPRGVTKSRGRFVARITKNAGCGAVYLGTFSSVEEAASAYCRAAQKTFGEFFRAST